MADHPHAPTSKIARRKISTVMDEAKAGTLRTSAGDRTTGHTQDVAIALSEGRRAENDSRLRRRRS